MKGWVKRRIEVWIIKKEGRRVGDRVKEEKQEWSCG